ncbi:MULTISPECIES: hypothetical protein [unclassified Dietzia]|nr:MULTISPECIES: hypothetical protein [unclassified Dietzia]
MTPTYPRADPRPRLHGGVVPPEASRRAADAGLRGLLPHLA